MSDPFYIGYLPKAAPELARAGRRRTTAILATTFGLTAAAAATLPYFGRGVFEYGRHTSMTGVLRCDTAPLLETETADLPLVALGKHGVPLELCGESGRSVTVTGTRISRDGREMLEVAGLVRRTDSGEAGAVESDSLGHFSLTGEIVDAKCYFGVMNPGEGRTHRACAQQCLRGGIPAVFIARDMNGAALPLLIADREGGAASHTTINLAGEAVVASGEVFRRGRWLVLQPDSLVLLPR